jgi:nitrite reductase/ring-hydroxylating ferredoxin subunit
MRLCHDGLAHASGARTRARREPAALVLFSLSLRSHPMPASPLPFRIVADARRLGECGGMRFELELDGVSREAFAVRYRGRVHAYVNSCRHETLPLDFGDAHFFDERCDALVCCHHGARYQPDTGLCIEGPCEGAQLTALVVEMRGNELWCVGAAPREAEDGRT